MTEFFNLQLFKFSAFLGGEGGIFLFCIGVLSIAFLISLLFSVLSSSYLFKKRVWYYFLLFGTCAFHYGISMVLSHNLGYSFLSLSLGLTYGLVIFVVNKNTEKERRQQVELAKLIDSEIKKEDQDCAEQVREDFSTIFKQDKICDSETKNQPNIVAANHGQMKKEVELDFSHVKNVISRLEYVNLSANDRRQVKDLENAVFLAEDSGLNLEMKSKINDGLGALLKIMSKYGV